MLLVHVQTLMLDTAATSKQARRGIRCALDTPLPQLQDTNISRGQHQNAQYLLKVT